MAAAVATATTAACTTAAPAVGPEGGVGGGRGWGAAPPGGGTPAGRGSARLPSMQRVPMLAGLLTYLNIKQFRLTPAPPKRGRYCSALTLDQILAAREPLYTIKGGRVMSNARRRWRRNCF